MPKGNGLGQKKRGNFAGRVVYVARSSVSPGYRIIVYILNRMNPLFTLGEEFQFHDSSRFRKKAGDPKIRFYHSFVRILMSLAAESCRSRADSVHLLKPCLQCSGSSMK